MATAFAFTTLLLASLVAQAEGVIQLPRTGQVNSFATGDDADLRAGVAWPSPRFTDHGNDTVTDHLTAKRTDPYPV